METCAAVSSFSAFTLSGFDPEVLRGVVHHSCFDQRLLAGGGFVAQIERLNLRRCSLDCGVYSLPVLARGEFERDSMAIAVAISCDQPLWASGHRVEQGRLMVFAEHHAVDVSIPANWRWCVLRINRELLMRTAQQRLGVEPRLPRSGWQLLSPPTHRCLQLCERILCLLDSASRWDGTRQQACFERAEQYLIDAFVDAIVECSAEPTRVNELLQRRLRALAQAERMMEEGLAEGMKLDAWCAGLDTQPRQLERLFKQVHGVGPCRWYKLARLNEARRRLASDAHADGVTGVAMELGFTHLGRFSADYRHLFEELPVETLAAARARRAGPK